MNLERIILTPEGQQKLMEEIRILKTKKRREVARQLEQARAHGDLRENSEYDAAKQAKQNLESRIAELEGRLARAQVVDPKDLPKGKAFLGATLEIKNLETGDTLHYTLVTQDEADLSKGKIAVTSPIGKGLLGKEPDAIVEIQIPAGKVRYQILRIGHG